MDADLDTNADMTLKRQLSAQRQISVPISDKSAEYELN